MSPVPGPQEQSSAPPSHVPSSGRCGERCSHPSVSISPNQTNLESSAAPRRTFLPAPSPALFPSSGCSGCGRGKYKAVGHKIQVWTQKMRISAPKMRLSRSGLWTEAQRTFSRLRARLRQPRAHRRWPRLRCGTSEGSLAWQWAGAFPCPGVSGEEAGCLKRLSSSSHLCFCCPVGQLGLCCKDTWSQRSLCCCELLGSDGIGTLSRQPCFLWGLPFPLCPLPR